MIVHIYAEGDAETLVVGIVMEVVVRQVRVRATVSVFAMIPVRVVVIQNVMGVKDVVMTANGIVQIHVLLHAIKTIVKVDVRKRAIRHVSIHVKDHVINARDVQVPVRAYVSVHVVMHVPHHVENCVRTHALARVPVA